MKNNDYLDWSLYLSNSLPNSIIKPLWLLPHDIRRSIFRKLFPKRYWSLMRQRRGEHRPYDYSFCERLSTIYIHIPKSAGQFISYKVLNGHAGHLTIPDYQIMFGSSIFNHAFKFTFVRNPWDRLVSAFFYLKQGGCNELDEAWSKNNLVYENFDEFVKDMPNKKFHKTWIHFIPQYRFITDPFGRILVDFIGKVENIDSDIRLVCKKLNLSPPVTEKKLNSSNHEHYTKYYTPETARIVEKIYNRDIKLFGYKFEN